VKRHVIGILLAATGLFGSSLSAAQTLAAETAAAACTVLVSTDFTAVDDAPSQITSARVVAPHGIQPGYCQVRGYVWPQVGFELRLPIATAWNGKFIHMGSGGSGGVLDIASFCPTHRGYACVVTDMGHQGTMNEGLWAYNNLQAQVDFGYRGTHVATVAGKAIAHHYYGRAPQRSYFQGCSTGSRQGLVEAQRFPWDFDGIVVGGVWIDDTVSTMTFIWASRALRDREGKPLITEADAGLIQDAVLARCDLDDGVKDGLIGNPLACKFDPAELRCKSGARAGCLMDVQVEAVQKVYTGPTTSKGVKLSAGGAVLGTERHWILDPRKGTNGVEYIATEGIGFLEEWSNIYFRWMVLPPAGRDWQMADFDFDRDYIRYSNGAQEALISDTNPDLRKFRDAGGKLLMFTGWNDSTLPRRVIDYYQTVERTLGGPEPTREFARLFMVPGMNHCSGGEGPFAVDWLSHMEAWVEQGKAPDVAIGSHVPLDWGPSVELKYPLGQDTPITFTRPIYPFPRWARYRGRGDPNKAENFKPVDP
jgi:feruloyl esterase